MTVFYGAVCLHLAVGLGKDFVVHFGTKKTWSPTVAVPRFEAVALPFTLEQQREAHADMLFYTQTDERIHIRRHAGLFITTRRTSIVVKL